MNIINSILPTKTNLIKIKNTIKLSNQGQELLEKKKYILIREKEKYISKCNTLRQELKKSSEDAYLMLRRINVDIGIEEVNNIARGISLEDGIDIKYVTIMGVEIPSVVHKKEERKMNYGIYDTRMSLDEAIIQFGNIKDILIELAVLESTIQRLNINIEKVQKRSNALKDIIIPNNQKMERQIQDILDEKEREEFSRLKTLKKKTIL